MPDKTKQDYVTLSSQLEGVLAALQRPDVQVDEAVKLYEQGLQLVSRLEKYLTDAQNKITKLSLQASGKD